MFKLLRLFIILLAALVISGWLWYYYQINAPVSHNQQTVSFEIKDGAGVNQISQALFNAGLISSKLFFEIYVWQQQLERNFISGVVELSPDMNIKQITAKLTQPGNSEITITIIEGWNNREIAGYLEKQGLFSQQEFLDEVGKNLAKYVQQYNFLTDKPSTIDLEGYLFPDTYRIYKNSNPEEVAKKMLDNLNRKLTPELRQKIDLQKKTIFEIITLASIIEKEVRQLEDMKMVADIFYKRLATNIALQSDATINYITSKGLVQPSLDDLKIESPYNTYLHSGLPPGPIANPGLNAISAAIEPTANDYYYFLTTKDGEVIYSKTFSEHQINKQKHLP